MKKTVIATGLGVAALAAMPLLSTFALEGAMQRTDHLTVTIDKGCTFTAEASNGVDNAVILAQGQAVDDIEGVEFDITCPAEVGTATWQLTAAGENGSKLSAGDDATAISSSSGTLDGSSSNWAFKLEATGSAKISENYDAYYQVPASATEVATGSGTQGSATVKAYYGVSAKSDQTPGTYTGSVVYTLTQTGVTD